MRARDARACDRTPSIAIAPTSVRTSGLVAIVRVLRAPGREAAM
jgi:hypothetical protein